MSTVQHRSSSGGIFIISYPFFVALIHLQEGLESVDLWLAAGGTPALPEYPFSAIDFGNTKALSWSYPDNLPYPSC